MKVDEQLGVIRVTRVVNAVAAGRIINTKTAPARSWEAWCGASAWRSTRKRWSTTAFGRVMNANIAEYHVPVNADVQDIKVIFVDEPDNIVNPLGHQGRG